MKKIVLYILSMIAIIFVFYSSDSRYNIERLEYTEHVEYLNNKYGDDKERILNEINKEINNKANSKEKIGMNLLTRQYYFYTWVETEDLIKNADETEKYLVKYKMDYELLQLYSMMASKYSGMEQYSKAYVYIYKGERIAKNIYEKNKNDENLSTLIAIKYLQAVVAQDMKMDHDAEIAFNEAEKMRNDQCNGKGRIDIYSNILLYYEDKKEYKLVEEYANKVIGLIDLNGSVEQRRQSVYTNTKIILAQNYINTNNINECIKIINELKEDDFTFRYNGNRYEMYKLYANVYKYYGYSDEYLEHLKIAYDQIKDTKANIRKFSVIESIIDELELLNEQEELLEWYKIERTLIKEIEGVIETQYLLSQIIDTDLQNANYNIEILELEKVNMRYLVVGLMMIVVIVIILTVILTRSKKILRENIKILENNMMIQHKYYDEIREHQEDIKRIQHDIRNHFTVLNQLIIQNEYEHAIRYIKNISNKTERGIVKISNNKIVDSIVLDKIKICKSKNIKLDLDIRIPEQINIDDFDICVIYGNIIDNAIEACENIDNQIENRYIKLKSSIKGNYLFINIINNYVLDINVKDNKFITSKRDKANHGLGIENVRKSVKKYQGDIKIEHTDNEFNVSIMIIIND